jgi:hypothetical protein
MFLKVTDPFLSLLFLGIALSVAQHFNWMREEDRPVRFRLILGEPGCFDGKDGPPAGLHRLLLSEPQPFDGYKLQRLSPAADFYRSLIGVRRGSQEGLQICICRPHSHHCYVAALWFRSRRVQFAIPVLLFVIFGMGASKAAAPQFPRGLQPFLNGQSVSYIAEVSTSTTVRATFGELIYLEISVTYPKS